MCALFVKVNATSFKVAKKKKNKLNLFSTT